MTLSEIKQTKAGQRPENAHVFEQKPVSKKNLSKLPKNDPEGLVFIKNHLLVMKVDFVTELQFSERKFRFDVAIPALKVAFEYNGIFSDKSRHTTVTGYSKDREKINLAQSLGWSVFEYTPLNYKNFIGDLKIILE